MVGPLVRRWRQVRQQPPSELETLMAGPLGGRWRQVWQRPPPELETSMVGPWGVLAAGLAAATTRIRDIDGRPPRGSWLQVRQRPPLELETSMVGPLGGAGGRSGSGHRQSWRRRW
jgi:hypothetical protein